MAVKKEDIIMEGFLVKQSGFLQQVSKKYYVLTRDHLYGFKRPEDLRQACECIKLDQHFQIRPFGAAQGADLLFGVQNWWLFAETPQLKHRWVTLLQQMADAASAS
mmetsp:Transcript_133718/g.316910  ORF Transcript_133718/g.316910 Transcript_133718/m.316910 type:complete len:106 (+) Transcript_133718:45-362(+)